MNEKMRGELTLAEALFRHYDEEANRFRGKYVKERWDGEHDQCMGVRGVYSFLQGWVFAVINGGKDDYIELCAQYPELRVDQYLINEEVEIGKD